MNQGQQHQAPGYPPQGQPGYRGQPVIVQSVVIPQEKFCGPITWIVGICLFPCICFCPLDDRPVAQVHHYGQPGYPPQGQPGYPPQGQPGYPPQAQPPKYN